MQKAVKGGGVCTAVSWLGLNVLSRIRIPTIKQAVQTSMVVCFNARLFFMTSLLKRNLVCHLVKKYSREFTVNKRKKEHYPKEGP